MQGGFAPDESVGSASLSLVPAVTQSSHLVPQYVRSGTEMPTRGRSMHRSLVPTRGSHGPVPNTVFWRSQSSSPVPGSSYVPDRPRRRAVSPRLSEMTRKLSHDIAGVSEKSEQSFRQLQNCREHYVMSPQRHYLRQLHQHLHKCMLSPMRWTGSCRRLPVEHKDKFWNSSGRNCTH